MAVYSSGWACPSHVRHLALKAKKGTAPEAGGWPACLCVYTMLVFMQFVCAMTFFQADEAIARSILLFEGGLHAL